MATKKTREALRARFGKRGYRITKGEEVHYFHNGWKFLGYLPEVHKAIEGDTFQCIYAVWENAQ